MLKLNLTLAKNAKIIPDIKAKKDDIKKLTLNSKNNFRSNNSTLIDRTPIIQYFKKNIFDLKKSFNLFPIIKTKVFFTGHNKLFYHVFFDNAYLIYILEV